MPPAGPPTQRCWSKFNSSTTRITRARPSCIHISLLARKSICKAMSCTLGRLVPRWSPLVRAAQQSRALSSQEVFDRSKIIHYLNLIFHKKNFSSHVGGGFGYLFIFCCFTAPFSFIQGGNVWSSELCTFKSRSVEGQGCTCLGC